MRKSIQHSNFSRFSSVFFGRIFKHEAPANIFSGYESEDLEKDLSMERMNRLEIFFNYKNRF